MSKFIEALKERAKKDVKTIVLAEGEEVRAIKAVIVQTTIVSKNTSKIPHIPCLTGSFTLEEECTITEEPRPASFEKTPRLQPCTTTSFRAAPVTPPVAGVAMAWL